MFLGLTQKLKMAAKNGGKMIFSKVLSVDSVDTLRVKIFVEIAQHQNFRRNCSISLRFQDKCVFAFSALRQIVTFSKSLISRPFCIGSLPKVFQTSI